MNHPAQSHESDVSLEPAEAVLSGIAARTNTDQVDLPPLYDTIDPEALDALVSFDNSCSVSFRYAGYDVTVEDATSVIIHEAQPPSPDGET